jgi:hypothetical protein
MPLTMFTHAVKRVYQEESHRATGSFVSSKRGKNLRMRPVRASRLFAARRLAVRDCCSLAVVTVLAIYLLGCPSMNSASASDERANGIGAFRSLRTCPYRLGPRPYAREPGSCSSILLTLSEDLKVLTASRRLPTLRFLYASGQT